MKAITILRTMLLAALVILCGAANAQITTATVTGTVTDATGAALPGASVTATNIGTKFTRTVPSGSDGTYRLEFLPIGDYTVTVKATGFKTSSDQKVTLNLNAEVRLDAALQPGDTSTTVNVNANDVPLVETVSSTLGRTVDNVEVDNLPIVDRNVYSLLSMAPGVQSNQTTYLLGYPQQVVYINGGYDNSTGSVSYYLDGGINMTMLRNTGNVLPNPDALQEFNVETNNYNALYGRMSAGLVNVVTKSGTNQVHGSIFEFFRNTNLAATPAFTPTKVPLHRHEFGATLGGPIKRDKTFFFGSYGGTRYISSQTYNSAIVPTLAEFNSGFTSFADRAPTSSGLTPTSSCSLTLSAADKAAGNFVICNPVTRKPLYSGTTPNAGLTPDPVALNVIKYLEQTGALVPGGNATNGVSPIMQEVAVLGLQEDEFLLKIDHNLTPSQRIEAAYFMSAGSQTSLPSSNLNWASQQYTYRQQNANLSDTWTISPSRINQVYLTYTRLFGGRVQTPALSLASFGSKFTPQGAPGLPQITVTSNFTLANSIGGPVAGTDFYSARDVYTLNKGKHSLSFGGEASLNKDVQQTLLDNYGVFTFASSTTARSGNPLSDFFYGLPSAIEQDSPDTAIDNDWFYGMFLQDDYKVLPRLTLNLGLRWDIQTAPTDNGQNRETAFVPGQQSVKVPTAPLGLLFVGDNGIGRGIATTRYHHISPRVGADWDVFGNGKTALRAASGVFYGMVSGNEWNMMSNYSPFAERFKFPSNELGTLSNPYAALPQGDPFPYIYNASAPFPKAFEPSQLDSTDLKFQWPYTYQTNVSVQQQFAHDLAVTISYVGSSSHDLPIALDVNAPLLGGNGLASTTSNADLRRPILPGQLTSVYNLQSHQREHYNALQVVFEKRMTHSLSVKGFYSWAKTLDTLQVQGTTPMPSPEPQDYYGLGEEYGRADDDIRHQSTTAVVWKPAYFAASNRIVHAVADGWTVSAIVTFQSGLPYSATTGVDTNLDGQTNDRASILPGQSFHSSTAYVRSNTSSHYFNPTYFCAAGSTVSGVVCPGIGPGGLDGNTRRNDYTGPGAKNVNAALFRDFGIYSRVKLQVRAEAVNVFNLVNLSNPNAALNSSSDGTIRSNAGAFPMREIQVGGRILF